MLRFLTAGESHGPTLIATIEGIPAGLAIDVNKVNHQLWLRQQGYGRGARQKIEKDLVEIIGGVRHGITSGAPIGLLIRNRDWDNWKHVMSVAKPDLSSPEVLEQLKKKAIQRFRPGHADLAGTLKFRQSDIRDVLERSSARETAARVAVGAFCQQLLSACGIELAAQVVQIGSIKASPEESPDLQKLTEQVESSELFCADRSAEEAMKNLIKSTWQDGDSLGGVIEVLAEGCPVGLGSYTQWDLRLDGQIAQALMSIQAMKAVEIGDGYQGASLSGSAVHDPILASRKNGNPLPFVRESNHAGGIEGGMTNGECVRIRVYMKPIPTLRKGLPSVSYPGFEQDTAHFERSDVCAAPAASIVCKAMLAFILSRALIDKFGGDTLADLQLAVDNYRKYCRELGQAPSAHSAPIQEQQVEAEAE